MDFPEDENEEDRLALLGLHKILNTLPERAFDDLVFLAAKTQFERIQQFLVRYQQPAKTS